jgi:hypothetical protein
MILTRKDGSPRLDGHKAFLDEKNGTAIPDVWDISRIPSVSM